MQNWEATDLMAISISLLVCVCIAQEVGQMHAIQNAQRMTSADASALACPPQRQPLLWQKANPQALGPTIPPCLLGQPCTGDLQLRASTRAAHQASKPLMQKGCAAPPCCTAFGCAKAAQGKLGWHCSGCRAEHCVKAVVQVHGKPVGIPQHCMCIAATRGRLGNF